MRTGSRRSARSSRASQHLVALGDDGEVALRAADRRRRRARAVRRRTRRGSRSARRARATRSARRSWAARSRAGSTAGFSSTARQPTRSATHRGVEAAERAADHAPCARAASRRCHRARARIACARRRRQLRAPPDDVGPVLAQPAPPCAAPCRLRRRAEAVQVEQVRRRASARAVAASCGGALPGTQRVEQLLVDAAEAAVAHARAHGRPARAAATTLRPALDRRRRRRRARPSARAPARRPSRGRRYGRTTRSASSSAQGSWAFIVPSFIVFERGSNTARMRSRRPCGAGR